MLSVGLWRWFIYNYHNSGHYPSSCLLFKTQLNSTQLNSTRLQVCLYLTGNLTSPLWAQQVNAICRFVAMVHLQLSQFWTLSIVLSFIWNSTQLTYRFVRTWQETLHLRYEPNRLTLSVGLWRWYINIVITILGVIHRPVFFLSQDVSETGFCLRLQVQPPRLGPIVPDRTQTLSLSTESICVGYTWARRQVHFSKCRIFNKKQDNG
jgi:hypothetical protein